MVKPISPKLCRSVGDASDLLRLLGNANRLAIVCFLMEQESTVSQLEDELGIRQPTLSQQLTELRDAGIIEGRRDGKNVIYRVVDDKSTELVQLLRGMFAGLDDVTSKRSTMAKLPITEIMFD
jgi:DNA-binding transcriptional ArsR family regulator